MVFSLFQQDKEDPIYAWCSACYSRIKRTHYGVQPALAGQRGPNICMVFRLSQQDKTDLSDNLISKLVMISTTLINL